MPIISSREVLKENISKISLISSDFEKSNIDFDLKTIKTSDKECRQVINFKVKNELRKIEKVKIDFGYENIFEYPVSILLKQIEDRYLYNKQYAFELIDFKVTCSKTNDYEVIYYLSFSENITFKTPLDDYKTIL